MPLQNKKLLNKSKGTLGIAIVQFDCDNNYPVGTGYKLDLSPYGSQRPYAVLFANSAGYTPSYSVSTECVRFFASGSSGGGVEAGNTDLAAITGVIAIALYDR